VKSPITTHVLETAVGRPARGVSVVLERLDTNFVEIARGKTNDDGRIMDWMPAGKAPAGTYRITFDTGTFYKELGQTTFYPTVSITFDLNAPDEHYHVPLLISPYGFSTYRGS
jgi:5-hydroxyisourate hydrolase